MTFRLGVIGAGQFSRDFLPLWLAHPEVDQVVVADRHEDRRAEFAARFGVTTLPDAEALLGSGVDAVAVFAQRHLHGPLAIAALEAGKHVFSAVPMASSVEEVRRIVELVAETRLVYSMGETCHYYPGALFCRRETARGTFGDVVYAESQYVHDMRHGFADAFRFSAGEDWRRVGGFPPMYYSTHTVEPVLAATGARVESVVAFGVVDGDPDGAFRPEVNLWGNAFSNEVALHRLSNGAVHRVVEFRHVGLRRPGTHIGQFIGTEAAYEFAFSSHYLHRVVAPEGRMAVDDVSTMLNAPDVEAARVSPGFEDGVANARWEQGLPSPILDTTSLPPTLRGVATTHRGTPPFLVDDFARAVVSGELPPVHAWLAARSTLPGLLSHASAREGGRVLEVPDPGEPPDDWRRASERGFTG